MTDILETIGLVVGYHTKAVAAVSDFRVGGDRVTVVTGPNGSGKTTLLKTLAGLLPPVDGRIAPQLPPGAGGIVFVHSTPYLFGGTVYHNVRMTSPANHDQARHVLQLVGAEHLRNQDVRRLSRGQRQRVALARALAAKPRVLLVDEPEGGLDAEGTGTWRQIVEQAVAARHPSMVIATHDLSALDGLPLHVVRLQ